jgi:hypothetical protein
MTNIQIGDTVEVVEPPTHGHYTHPDENRLIRAGDQFVVVKVTLDLVSYWDFNKKFRGMYRWRVKKVVPNQVEIKFR